MPMIELDRVVKIYDGKSRVVALDEISFVVDRGEMVAVMGQSGSGKSTLLNIIGGLDRPTRGAVRIDGVSIQGLDDDAVTRVRREKIGFVFQFFNLLPTLSASDNVALPLRLRRLPASEVVARTTEMLALVGLEPRSRHLPDELSGGECQRVAIARALVMNPRVVLADEPTGNLDSKTGSEILDLLQRLNRELSSTLVMVTHDASAAAHCHRILRLRDGRLEGDERVSVVGREGSRG
jgi:putative ABC transport system ATP-binding protein